MVRLRQLIDRLQHRLLLVPIMFVVGALIFSQIMLYADRQVASESLPRFLETTVGSGRAILSAVAGGLISSVTLLLSLMLVAVQLAGSQYSPRTLRDWIGDRTQQKTIGLVLGTAVYCLLILRETRTFGEGDALTPHLSVMAALVLGVASLVGVVRSVDHLTNSLRIGSVASRIMDETVKVIERDKRLSPADSPTVVPVDQTSERGMETREHQTTPPAGALAIIANEAGWIQQIDEDAVIAASPDGSTVYVAVTLGAFAMPNAPLAWIWPAPDDDECLAEIRGAIAIGDSRTMQQDIGFGILQMVDIALRALSPGVNDPNTANDLIAHLGVIMLSLWERPFASSVRDEDGRTLLRDNRTHGDYLHAGFDPIRRYGATDPEVAGTMIRVLATLHTETRRRELAGPLEPIEEIIDQILAAVDATELSDYDKQLVRDLAPKDLDRFTS